MILFFADSFILMLAVVSYLRDKKSYNPATVFLGFWGALLLLASLHLYDLLPFSNEIVCCVFVGCIFFFLGTFAMKYKYKINTHLHPTFEINKKLTYILTVVCIVTLVYRISFQLPYLLAGYSISDIRYMSLIKYPAIQGIIFNFFSLPFLDAAATVLMLDCIMNFKRVKSYILPIIMIILSFISNGARLSIFQAFIVIAYALIILKRVSIKRVKGIFKYIILFLILLVFVDFINTNRGSGNSIFKSLYVYFSGSIIYADKFIKTTVFDEYLYGINSIGGILRPIYSGLGLVGVSEPDLLAKAGEFMSQSCQNTVFAISSNSSSRFNYMSTLFLYFYKDGGYIAIAIASFLYGIVCRYFYVQLKKDTNIHSLAMYIFILIGIFTSFVHFCFSSFIYVMSFIYIFIITTRLFKEKR